MMKPSANTTSIWNFFEKAFKIADYIFKFFSWTVLCGAVDYLGRKYELSDLVVVSGFMYALLGAIAGVFATYLVFRSCERVRDRRIYAACAFSSLLFLNSAIVMLEFKINDVAAELASHK